MELVSGSGPGEQRLPGTTPRVPAEVHRALEAINHEARTRILAGLARWFGDLDLAEDLLQEALAQALRTWPETGVPEVPEAWLITTAKRKGIDTVRRRQILEQKLPRLRIQEDRTPTPEAFADPAERVVEDEAGPVNDERLGLFFACCHPLLSAEDRIALTLRFLAGLSSSEVAHALLVPVPTMQQRIVRAKKRIRTLGISFGPPRSADLAARLAGVQRVIYLFYAEGFARSTGEDHIRDDLTVEAIRLARLLRELTPGSAETTGLLGLLLLHESRRDARTDDQGRPMPLADQDRERWDQSLIQEGILLTEAAAAAPGAGSYAIQAAIAAVHAEAADFDGTDWGQIAVLYRMLEGYEPGPVVRLGRAVAMGRAHGAETGLRQLKKLAEDPALDRFRAFHVASAMTFEELGQHQEAAAAYRRALELPGNEAEGRFLAGALHGLNLPSGAGC